MPTDPFEMLGVSRDADPNEIKKAFRRLAKKYHPDIAGGSDEQFKRILLAYEKLSGYNGRDWDRADHFDFELKVSIDREKNKVQDLFDDIRDGLLAFFDFDAPEYLDLFVEMSPAQAARGGRLKLDLPLLRKCRKCMGFGKPMFTTCKSCGGSGEEEYRRDGFVDIPENAEDGWRTRLIVDSLHLTVILKVRT